ncbi:MAG: acyltransferase family protein [Acidimicrobiales bacterium]
MDGIRALAVLGVIAYHLGFGWAGGGLLGVAVFFVLSGYLITDLLLTQLRKHGAGSFRQFWLRRARRLLPALFIMLIVVTAWVTLLDRSQLASLRSDFLPAVFYFSNWWYIFHHVSYFQQYGPPSPLGHLWSLAIEEQFYLVWPLALLAALRWLRDKRILIATILTLAAGSAIEMAFLFVPYTDPTRVYDGTDTRAFELLIGAAVAVAWPRGRTFRPLTPRARTMLEVVGGAMVVAIIVLYWRTGQYDPFVYQGGMVLLSACTAILIAVCVHPGARIGRALGVEPLRWLGERSYGVYLWSVPIIVLTTPTGAKQNLLRDLLQVVAIVVVSALSWRFLEQPIRHGALGRIWAESRRRWSARDWGGLVPRSTGLVATTTACAAAVVCVLGLSGFVTGAAQPGSTVKTVLPVMHHHEHPHARQQSSGTQTTVGSTATTPPPPPGQGVTIIGDSIMVDAAPYLQQLLPHAVIDAKVGQQLYQLLTEVPQLKQEGAIGNQLILELGTNGYFSVTQLETLLRSLGPMKKVVLVNTRETRPWEQAVNQTIATVAKSYPNTTMVDWYDLGAKYPQYFDPDQVHLDPQGAQYFASLLVHALQTSGDTASAPPATPPASGHAARRGAS